MERIDFLNPVINSGLNYTVRLGDKWFRRLELGDQVLLGETDGDIIGEAVVAEIRYVRAGKLPPQVYDFAHDPACRVSGGLHGAMVRAYPELAGGRFWNALVTVIGFVPVAFGNASCRPDEREAVYSLTDGEIAYARKWDEDRPLVSLTDKDKPVECWLTWMDTYLDKAKKAASSYTDKTLALDNIRKLAGLAVICMKYHKNRSREEEKAEKSDDTSKT